MRNVFIAAILVLFSTNSIAQVIEYSDQTIHPSVVYDNLLLTLEPDTSTNTVKGVVTWRIRLIDEKPDSLSFNLYKGQVNSVRVDEISVGFSYQFDRLSISIPESAASDSTFKIEVNFLSNPDIGLHVQKGGMHWSSTLPGSRSDLFPTIHAPSVRVSSDIRIIVPNSWKAIANGFESGSTLLHDDRRLYHWRSTVPISVADISVVYGPIDITTARINSTEINIVKESESIAFLESNVIISHITSLLDQAMSLLSREFPYESVNVVLIDDHKWEFKSASAGVIYVYKNGGDYLSQLTKGIAATYFGSYHKPFKLSESDHILLLQARMFDLLGGSQNNEGFKSDYPAHPNEWQNLSPQNWLKAYFWVKNFGSGSSLFQSENLAEILSYDSGSYSSEDYVAMLESYENARFPDFINPGLPDTTRFDVIYTHDYQTQRISIEFVPQNPNSITDDFLPIKIRQFTDGAHIDLDFQISRLGDRISVNTNGFTNNMYVINQDSLSAFNEIKPAEFWRFQLRNDPDYRRRLEAAEGFGRVVDDPDIQLFLQDLIRTEPDELVKERLVLSFSQLTNGARGTHQRFIGLLNDPSNRVRSAALESLKKFPGNAEALEAVYSIISTSQDITFVNQAIEVYFVIADQEEFFATGRGLLVEDQKDLQFTATILPLIIQTERGKNFGPNLMQYLEAEFPFFIRNIAFKILNDVEISASYWQDLLPILATDPDPRVRFLSAPLFDKIDADTAGDILSEWVRKEYDVRVLQQLQEMLSKR